MRFITFILILFNLLLANAIYGSLLDNASSFSIQPPISLPQSYQNLNNAMSGRPHGPYTVKNLSPVVGNL